MSHPLNDKIIALIDYLGINQKQFAESIGMERADTIYNICKHKTKCSTDVIELILQKYPRVNSEWLFKSKKPIELEEKKEDTGELIKFLNDFKDNPEDPTALVNLQNQILSLMQKNNQLEQKLKVIKEQVLPLIQSIE